MAPEAIATVALLVSFIPCIWIWARIIVGELRDSGKKNVEAVRMNKVADVANRCVFCSGNEGNICSRCMQKILAMDQAQLKAAYALAVEKGLAVKAEALSTMIEGDAYVPETGKVRSNLERKGFVRASRPARHQVRA